MNAVPLLVALASLLAACVRPEPAPTAAAPLSEGTTVSEAPGPPDLVGRALSHPESRWDSLAARTATVYVQPGSHAAGRVGALAAAVDAAVDHALVLLDEEVYPHRLRVFFVGSRAEMESLVGQPVTGAAIAEQRAVFLVAAPDWRPLTRHEVFHAVSVGLWGHPLAPTDQESFLAGGWLREGTATAAEGQCAGTPLHDVVATMQREAALIPLDTLATDFYAQNDLDAYLQAGSLLDFVRLRYGPGAIRTLWDRGPDAFPDATGAAAAEVEAAWHAWLDAVPVHDPPDLAALRELGCGGRP